MEKSDFSEKEWQLLIEACQKAAAAVAAASESNRKGRKKESEALNVAPLRIAVQAYKDRPFIRDLAEDGGNPEAVALANSAPEADPEGLGRFYREEALLACQEAGALAEDKILPDDDDAYRGWVMDVCLAVAKAAEEGSRIRRTRTDVSPAEHELMNEIADALQYSQWSLEE